jgi:hypothetical protein
VYRRKKCYNLFMKLKNYLLIVKFLDQRSGLHFLKWALASLKPKKVFFLFRSLRGKAPQSLRKMLSCYSSPTKGPSILAFFVILISVLFFSKIVFPRGDFPLPPLPPPEVYGDVLINRASSDKNMTAVVFSHWVHRVKYKCNVCHVDLEFATKTGIRYTTEKDFY